MSDPGRRGPQPDRARAVSYFVVAAVELTGLVVFVVGVQTDSHSVLGAGAALLSVGLALAVMNFVRDIRRRW